MTRNMIKNTPYPNYYKDVIYIYIYIMHRVLYIYIYQERWLPHLHMSQIPVPVSRCSSCGTGCITIAAVPTSCTSFIIVQGRTNRCTSCSSTCIWFTRLQLQLHQLHLPPVTFSCSWIYLDQVHWSAPSPNLQLQLHLPQVHWLSSAPEPGALACSYICTSCSCLQQHLYQVQLPSVKAAPASSALTSSSTCIIAISRICTMCTYYLRLFTTMCTYYSVAAAPAPGAILFSYSCTRTRCTCLQ